MWPDTLDIMGWTVDPVGFGVVLSQGLPRFLEERLAEPARAFVDGLDLATAPHFVCHLGSSKVLAAIETALDLRAGKLASERAVLRQHGNMSSPSVLFVLEHALKRGLEGPAVLAAADRALYAAKAAGRNCIFEVTRGFVDASGAATA